ncbi:MAG: hypothetical protein M1831_007328 [Alyxoria varia]|nr:MAG: hypothetical protein M1831_007328 [Alyxoria varia]
MPSNLRNVDFPPTTLDTTIGAASAPSKTSPTLPPAKKQKMSITRTYLLAHTARGKLSTEASQADHDLRLLVGHANLLDTLTVELQDAEREQEAWFEQTVKASRKAQGSSSSKRVQWKDEVAVEDDEDLEIPDASDGEDSDSDASDDSDIEEDTRMNVPQRTPRSSRKSLSPPPRHPAHTISNDKLSAFTEVDDSAEEDDDIYEDDEERNDLSLIRTPSHSSHPPELVHDSSEEEDSDDEEPGPSSPPAVDIPFTHQGIKSTDFAAAGSILNKPTHHGPTALSTPVMPAAPAIAAY